MNNKLLPLFIIILCWVFGALWWYIFTSFSGNISSSTIADPDTPQSIQALEESVTSLVREVSPSVVSIIAKQDMNIYRTDPWWFFRYRVGSVNKKVGWWTGFFISSDGIIITNKHVIEDSRSSYTVILNDGTELETEILGFNRFTDIAFLKVMNPEKSLTPLQFVDSWNIQIGQFAIAIWNALSEFQNSVSFGVVSGINRSIEDASIKLDWLIQTDTAINPWNSGWPLLNTQWQVMWINTVIINWSQNIWFAIELSQTDIEGFLKELKK